MRECGLCFGTGLSGDAMDNLDPRNALRIPQKRVKEAEQKRSTALEHAIHAFRSKKQRY